MTDDHICSDCVAVLVQRAKALEQEARDHRAHSHRRESQSTRSKKRAQARELWRLVAAHDEAVVERVIQRHGKQDVEPAEITELTTLPDGLMALDALIEFIDENDGGTDA